MLELSGGSHRQLDLPFLKAPHPAVMRDAAFDAEARWQALCRERRNGPQNPSVQGVNG